MSSLNIIEPTMKSKTIQNNELLSTNDIFKLTDLYYKQKYILYSHLHRSFDKFLDDDVRSLLTEGENIFFEKIDKDILYRYKFVYSDIAIKPPMIDTEDEILFPSQARIRSLTYSAKLVATISQVQETININTDQKTSRVIGFPEKDFPIANIPIMVKSKYCSLNLKKGQDKTECDLDPGGYFIVRGSEKVVMSLERMCDNKPLVFIKKDSNSLIYTAQVNSKSYGLSEMTQIVTIRMKKDGILTIRVPILHEIPVFILFRALGVESDNDIINTIVYDINDTDMINLVRISLENSRSEDKNIKIMTQEAAFDYLINKIRVPKRYSDTDEQVRITQKKIHLESLLKNNFLPHMKPDKTTKAYYLGYMINRLLQCYLGRISKDDRDSYVNKRVDLPGNLIFELFKQYYKKMLNECSKHFRKRNNDDKNPLNIIKQIKSSIIELGLNAALLTGAWGKRKGVAQMLQRLTFLQTISSLRRINSPTVDASTNKLTSPRHLHASQISFICVSGDTIICLENGQLKRIKDLNGNEKVITVNKNDLSEVKSSFYNLFSKMPEKMLKITTISGRTIKCDPDHPFMVKYNNQIIWKKAEQLTLEDCVVVRHTKKYIDNNILSYINENDKILLTFENNEYEPEIIARLIGFINLENNCKYFKLNSMQDIFNILYDLDKIGFTHSSLYINDNKLFINDEHLSRLVNIFGESMKVPSWLCNSNLNIVREYLDAFICKEEYYEYENNNNETIINIRSKNLDNDFDKYYEYYKSISHLFELFDLKVTVKEIYSFNKRNVAIEFNNDIVNINKFFDHFTFCYDSETRNNKNIDVEYYKTMLYNNNQYINKKDFIEGYKINNGKILSRIHKIENIKPELVYDFTTFNQNHSFIGNSFCLHNCPVETPEGHKVGLVKNLSMIGNITIMSMSQVNHIKSFLQGKLIDLNDIQPGYLNKYTKVFLNGEWLGLSKKPRKLYLVLKDMKYNKNLDATTSIVHEIKSDIESKELKIYCDGGRLYRPVLRVKNNELLLKKSHIDLISLDGPRSATNITDWNEFIVKNPGIIEYVDVDENINSMVAMYEKDIVRMKKRETDSINMVSKLEITDNYSIINRYNDMVYVNYTHCEIHPSLLIGVVAATIPFCNHNQGPRNMFQYSQARQAMGIYISNYRTRLDISYILYHAQTPLVLTRAMKYIGTDMLPYGENVIVAIACYTGYNQEDSIIMNQSSIDRGLFRSTSLKKYQTTIQKNQQTSQDDIFIKPDRSKVAGTKHGSYDKLEETTGLAPEETFIEHGDIIIGKISPIQPVGNNNKTFKDSSEVYKSHVSGYIDKIWTGIYDNEGYEMRKLRVRSERIPYIGDKFCMKHDVDVLTIDGWKRISNITKNDKVAILIDNNIIKYENPLEVYNFDYNGDMYKLTSKYIDIDVTIDHELYVKTISNTYIYNSESKFELKPAKEIVGKNIEFKKNCTNVNLDQSCIILQNNDTKITFDMNPFLKLVGTFITCGHLDNENTIYFTCATKNKLNNINDICKTLDIELIKSDKSNIIYKYIYEFHDETIYRFFKNCDINGLDKSLPKFVFDLSQTQSQILLNSIVGSNEFSNRELEYYTYSKKLIDDIMILTIHAGWSAIINDKVQSINYENNSSTNDKSIDDKNKDLLMIRINKSKNNPYIENKNKGQEEIYKYNGKVYCLQVSSHVFMARFNNKNVWIGNCSRAGQKGTIGIKLKSSDMPFTKNGIQPDIIMNPNAIPSRMTLGQFVEALTAKVAALEGHETDGTPFNDIDINEQKKRLKKLGYDENGYEYMYNGMTGRKMKTKIFICPTYYLRLKHMVKDKIHCLTMDHEILTENGWKFFNDINETEKVATLINGFLSYVKPIKLLYYPNYKGKIYNIETEQVSLSVTDNHRMYIKYNLVDEYKGEFAEKIINKNVYYKKNAKSEFNCDEKFDFNELKHCIKLPDWIWTLSSTKCKQIINYITNDNNYYFTKSTVAADEFMKLCLHAEWSANKVYDNNNGYILNIVKGAYNEPSTINKISENIVDFNGPVFCLMMPKNTRETFYVRKNGKPVWTCNSRARGPRTALTRQAPEGRARDGGLRFGEMERDCVLSHGMASFLKERTMETADAYSCHVCVKCGLFAQRLLKTDHQPFTTENDVYHCPACKNSTEIAKIRIPYAFKLLIQEMMAMNIAPRIRVKQNKFSG